MSTRPYFSVQFTPENLAHFAKVDPGGILVEATHRSDKVLTRVLRAIAQAHATVVVTAEDTTPEPPALKATTYGRLASGEPITALAKQVNTDAYKAGVKVDYATVRDYLVAEGASVLTWDEAHEMAANEFGF